MRCFSSLAWRVCVRQARRVRACVWLALLFSGAAPAQQTHPADLADRSLEDLMNTEVTSVSKKQQKISDTAAAIFVITQEDIRRSGATSFPDLLRMVPGIHVAQIDGSNWAISSRGFNNEFSDKLLVLIDGRTVYSALNSGVDWGAQDVLLEDVERIEVIRGPGATIWGANAVNGVINILTKKAADTQGGLLKFRGGNLSQGFGAIRFGGTLGRAASYRVFTKFFNNSHLLDPNGQDGGDGYDMLHGGFRVDDSPSEKDSVTFQGDLYRSSGNELLRAVSLSPPESLIESSFLNRAGGNLLTRWDHTISSRSETDLEIYFDRAERSDLAFDESRDTFELDFSHHVAWGTRNDFVWGTSYRRTTDDTSGTLTYSFNPASQARQLFAGFVQDEIVLRPDRLRLTAGMRVEHNDYTGFEFQPNLRLAWTPLTHQCFWFSWSKAQREPARSDISLRVGLNAFPGANGVPTLVSIIADSEFTSEVLNGYDFGYRTELGSHLSLDFAAFFNRYHHLLTVEPVAPFFESTPPPPHNVIAFTVGNSMHGETHGLEVVANWKVTRRWTLSPTYSLFEAHMHLDPSSQDTTSVSDVEGSDPRHSAQLRSHLQLPRGFSWDASASFVDRLADQRIPSYTRFDSVLSWQASERVWVSIVGQNLLKNQHVEFNEDLQLQQSSAIKRSAYAKFTWRF